LMREPLVNGVTKIIPNYFSKTYFHWIDNLRDWCISRQIWFGHRIPVWYKDKEVYCGIKAPDGEGWEQDSDVLDTWFSSALWPFSTMGWPEETSDIKNYYPTTVLETGYDIIFFWVARMILSSQFLLGKIPFQVIYLHGIVRDSQGRKISKSLGNNIDPINMGEKYGTDALRFSLVSGAASGTDTKISEEKIKGYKNFANKIWNITRFVLSNTENYNGEKLGKFSKDDEKLLSEFNEMIKDVTADMDNFRFYLVAEKLYHYIWHEFADKIIEGSKEKLKNEDKNVVISIQYTLRHILETSLILLHPFMPFITEEIWSKLNKDKLLIVTSWPSTRH